MMIMVMVCAGWMGRLSVGCCGGFYGCGHVAVYVSLHYTRALSSIALGAIQEIRD